ncbi:hypothetical protein ACFL9T_03120 [Thermodesulfobacteriota bacterium]
MNKKYRVVYLGLLASRERFKDRMSDLGVAPEVTEMIFDKAPVILKAEMTLSDARRYADAILHAGGQVRIQQEGELKEPTTVRTPFAIQPLESFTMCPECGYKQLKAENCERCGNHFDKQNQIS